MEMTRSKRDKNVLFEVCRDKGTRCSKKGQNRLDGTYGHSRASVWKERVLKGTDSYLRNSVKNKFLLKKKKPRT